MCRYAFHRYKPRFACFFCRKSFRLRLEQEMTHKPLKDEQGTLIAPCPQCGMRMFDIGMDFQVPKQSDLKSWESARLLAQVGVRYQGCGCDGGGWRPRTPREVKAFVESYRDRERRALFYKKGVSNLI